MQASVNRSAFAGRNVAPATRRSVVVAVKPTKATEFRSLSNEELLSKIAETKKQLSSTRFMQKTRGISLDPEAKEQQQPDPEKVPKGHLNKQYRRIVAQCLTELRARQIADGIDR